MWRTVKSSGNSNTCQISSTKWGGKMKEKHTGAVFTEKKKTRFVLCLKNVVQLHGKKAEESCERT